MKNILAFAGSNSSTSINHTLVKYIATQLTEHNVKIIQLKDYPMPIYSEDLEKSDGFGSWVRVLNNEIKEADALLISVNEHNWGWSAFFKNTIDWLSRLDRNFLAGKKVLLMSTSPGRAGGAKSLQYGKEVFPKFGAEIIESFSLPSFHHSFSEEKSAFLDENVQLGLQEVLSSFSHQIQ